MKGSDVKALIAYAEQRGCTAVMGRGGHWKILSEGRLVMTFGGTPSSKRSMLNSRSFLRRRLAELGK